MSASNPQGAELVHAPAQVDHRLADRGEAGAADRDLAIRNVGKLIELGGLDAVGQWRLGLIAAGLIGLGGEVE